MAYASGNQRTLEVRARPKSSIERVVEPMAPIGSVLRVEINPSGTVWAALSREHLDLEGIFKRTQKMGGGSP